MSEDNVIEFIKREEFEEKKKHEEENKNKEEDKLLMVASLFSLSLRCDYERKSVGLTIYEISKDREIQGAMIEMYRDGNARRATAELCNKVSKIIQLEGNEEKYCNIIKAINKEKEEIELVMFGVSKYLCMDKEKPEYGEEYVTVGFYLDEKVDFLSEYNARKRLTKYFSEPDDILRNFARYIFEYIKCTLNKKTEVKK